MVANESSMYNRVLVFRTSLDSTLQLQLYTSLKQTPVAFYDCDKQRDADDRNGCLNFISKPGVFFRGMQLNNFMNLYISCGMAPPHIIGASDLAIRKVWFNPNKGRLSVMNLRSPGPVAGAESLFLELIQGSVRSSLVLFKTKWRP